jgi:hypothetical protein
MNNCCFPGLGTVASSWKDRKGCNCTAWWVGILQQLLTPLCGIGWFWSMYHGWIVYQNSKGKKEEFVMNWKK